MEGGDLMTSVLTEKDPAQVKAERLARFDKDTAARRHKTEVLTAYHRDAFIHGDVELPWSGDAQTVYVTEYLQGESHEVDIPTTEAKLKAAIKNARRRGFRVEKKYDDDDFTVTVYLEEKTEGNYWGIRVVYNASRKVVCEKKVVGQEVVPATTRDIVQWDCKKIAFTV
jgi:hypothetical protein